MQLHQLYAKTAADRKYLASFVRLSATKIGHTRDGLGFIAAKTQSYKRLDSRGFLVPVPPSQRSTYVSTILFKDKKLNVKVACSCADNLYRWEYSNARKKAADIYYSNGEPPVSTNPRLIPGMCKHLCALYMKIAHKVPRI